jgi:hypothetical protein
MVEALGSTETLVLTTAIRHDIREDGILHSHRRENLKSYERYQILGPYSKENRDERNEFSVGIEQKKNKLRGP